VKTKEKEREKEEEYIFTSYECMMLRKNPDTYIYRMKNIISSLPNYILMLRARTKNGTKMATNRKMFFKYIQ
jgi:hypothetical protein